MTTLLTPTSTLVAQAWLRSLPALAGVDTQSELLPVGQWTGQVFVQITPIGGGVDSYVPVRTPVMQIDVWAKTVDSNRPAWGRANAYAESIRDATYGSSGFGTFAMGLAGFEQAHIYSVEVRSEPKIGYGDAAALARYSIDLLFTYVPANLVIA